MNRELWRAWWGSRLGFIAIQAVAIWGFSLALRLVLALSFARDISGGSDWLKVFLVGLHLDLVVSWFAVLPFWILVLSCPERWFRRSGFQWGVYVFNVVFWVGAIFLGIAEFFFFEEFRSRFNTVAIDYLLYPHEVFVNIWDSYPVPAVIAGCCFGAIGMVWAARRVATHLWEVPLGKRVRKLHAVVYTVIGGLLVLSVSLNETRFSRERILNELASNGMVSVLTAAWSRNLDYSAFYPTLPTEEAHRISQELLREKDSQFVTGGLPNERWISGDTNKPRPNLVVLLEESLGSEFWGCLGRSEASLTPAMDRLATQEGMLFENLYATGNRTVRGFEGVLSSFPPLPGDSIVKRDRSENVETIARVLKRDGYETLFLYGGRGVFDGMRAYAVRNGYDRFIEQKDFPKPTFTTIWGVCNEDLYTRTLEEIRTLHQAGKPFFITALSVSNHKPFTYPDGRISEPSSARKRENAVKYTDWALGQFFVAAKREAFWKDTIFVVVADHGARVYGSQTIPIRSYEIPMVVLGPRIVDRPSRVSTLGCQLDVAPTLLGLIGRPYRSLFFGRDLLRDVPGERLVLINHNRSIGAYRDQRLVVLSLNKKTEVFHGNPKLGQMKLTDKLDSEDGVLIRDATALFQLADEEYMSRRYTLDRVLAPAMLPQTPASKP